jgi:glycosyltransferase involved in cell wall biosynthesis
MKIAIDINGIFGTSGLSQHVKLLVKNLATIDRENEYLLYAHFWKNRPITGIELRLPDNFKFIHQKFPETLTLLSDFKLNMGMMEKFLSGRGGEIYHGTGNMAPKFKKIKTVLTIHHYYPVEGPLTPADLNWREKFYFRCTDYSIPVADFIITDSASTKSEIMRRFNLKETSVSVIYPGEPDPAYRPLEKKESGKYILFVGPINERKNLGGLLKAFSILVRKGIQHRLVITGTGKETYINLIKKLCSELKIQDRIVFTGKISPQEMVHFYNNAEFLVYPSLYEGFGYPPLEAMACGCPVAASNATSIPEIVGDAAVLFDPYNAEEMARVIENLSRDSDLRQELIKKSFEQVKKFSWEKTAKETLQVYKRVYKNEI